MITTQDLEQIMETAVKVQIPQPERYYYKCRDCLTPVTLSETISKSKISLSCECGSSPKSMIYMGRVNGTGYVIQTEVQCKCNEVCANAQGPNCNCACGGTNHGDGLAAYVEVDVVTGKVSAKSTPKDKAKAHAEWFRAKLAWIESGDYLGSDKEAWELQRKGGWNNDYKQWIRITKKQQMALKFKESKSYKHREKVLAEIEGMV